MTLRDAFFSGAETSPGCRRQPHAWDLFWCPSGNGNAPQFIDIIGVGGDGNALTEKPKCLNQQRYHWLPGNRSRARLFRQLLARRIDGRRQVRIGGRKETKQPLQIQLARRRQQQIGAAHHFGNTLHRVVDDDRKLVGEIAIGAVDNKIADVPPKIAFDSTLPTILEHDTLTVSSYAQRARRAPGCEALTTGSRVNETIAAAQTGIGNFASAASAWVNRSGSTQLFDRFAIRIGSCALVRHGLIPVQTEAFERTQDIIRGTRHLARWINVFDAHQPLAVIRACLQEAADGGDKRTEMQRSGRRRRKTPAIN